MKKTKFNLLRLKFVKNNFINVLDPIGLSRAKVIRIVSF